jgi:hypothetical protein
VWCWTGPADVPDDENLMPSLVTAMLQVSPRTPRSEWGRRNGVKEKLGKRTRTWCKCRLNLLLSVIYEE